MASSDRANVLIAGGGVAALEAALALRERAGERVSVELLAPEPHFWYRPLAVASPFGLGGVQRFELSALTADAGASFTLGKLVSVDAHRRIAYASPGGGLPYSMLLVACGTRPTEAVEGALTFRGPADMDKLVELLAELANGAAHRVAFAVPPGAVWSLPAYELALLTSAWLAERSIGDVEIALVTPEDAPLAIFGREASDAVREVLAERGIAVHEGVQAVEAREGELLLSMGGIVAADRVVALPRLRGTRIAGIPQTLEGFVPVDERMRVIGLPGVFAAGDITTFAPKQGGIAAQQADVAAEAIAAEAGVDVEPHPFRPVLRGMLLTGAEPRYLRTDLLEETSEASLDFLWWPPAKLVGRHLAPFLARISGTEPVAEGGHDLGIPVELELELGAHDRQRDQLMEATLHDAPDDPDAPTVAGVMTEALLVAPEDTLGEVAERMLDGDVAQALVVDYGRLVGLLTSSDMLGALAARVHSSEARVREWMTLDPIAVSPRTTLEAAATLMAQHAIHHLPVVEGDRPVGTVGVQDLLGARAEDDAAIGLGF